MGVEGDRRMAREEEVGHQNYQVVEAREAPVALLDVPRLGDYQETCQEVVEEAEA